MNWRSIWAIARKDLKEVRQNKVAWGPAIAIPLIFAIAHADPVFSIAAGDARGGYSTRAGGHGNAD
jgi:hypothetical protein